MYRGKKIMKIEEDKLNKKFIDVLEQIACRFPAIGHKGINGKIKKQKNYTKQIL